MSEKDLVMLLEELKMYGSDHEDISTEAFMAEIEKRLAESFISKT